MGKATIISNDDAKYTIKLEYDLTAYSDQKIVIENNLTAINTKIAAIPLDPTPSQITEKRVLKLQKIALEKRLKEIEKIKDEVDTEIVDAWCADYSTKITGSVGTIEVPNEKTNINIFPAFAKKQGYNASRDGQLSKTALMYPEAAYYNIAMLPGWQKWKPLYRYATITTLDKPVDKATIQLTDIVSSQQGLSINQTNSISNVSIEYMDCNAKAFSVGDSVLVKFEGQDWSSPKIIGFSEDPKPCFSNTYILIGHRKSVNIGEEQEEMPEHEIFWVWNCDKDELAKVYTDETLSTEVSFPTTLSGLEYFFSITEKKMYTAEASPVYKTSNLVFGEATSPETITCGTSTFINTKEDHYENDGGTIISTSVADIPWYEGVCKIRTNDGGQEFYYTKGLTIDNSYESVYVDEAYNVTVSYIHDFYLNMPWGTSSGTLRSEMIYDWVYTFSNLCVSLNGHQYAFNPWADNQTFVFLNGRAVFSDSIFVGIGSISGWEGVTDPLTCANTSEDPVITNWKAVNDIAVYFDPESTEVNFDPDCITKAKSHKGLNDILEEILQWCYDNGGGTVWDELHSWQWMLDEGQVLDVYTALDPIPY